MSDGLLGWQRADGARGLRVARGRGGRRPALLALAGLLVLCLAGFAAPSAQAAEEATFTPEFSCSAVTFRYEGFPNASNNTVTEKVTIDGKTSVFKKFHFNGPTGVDSVPVSVPPGHHSLDAHAFWSTNGVKGGKDIPLKGGITCEPDPGFAIEKKQKIDGSKPPYQTTPLTGKVGQQVDYAIVVTNTGNVALTFNEFTDPKCDEGTISGGPGANPVGLGEHTIYYCDHVLTAADDAAGSYTNAASVTGTPPPSDGSPITHESNTVVVELTTRGGRVTSFSCHSITFVFEGFPNLPGNTVTEKVTVDGQTLILTKFTFNGPYGTNTLTFNLPPGHHAIDGHATWNTNGFKGNFDNPLKGGLNCTAGPAFTIEKLQKLEGSKAAFTTSRLMSEQSKVIDYEIVVTNTGNVPLTFSSFTDSHCEEVSGGPGGAVAPGAATTYFCHSPILPAGAYPWENTASVTGTPPAGEGSPITHESNEVVTELAKPSFSISKAQEIDGVLVPNSSSGKVGEEIVYHVFVENTGNVPLTLSNFTDERCEGVSIHGENPVAPGNLTYYECHHVLTEQDREAGEYANSATVTGTPPEFNGPPITHESNTVKVEVK